MQLPLTRRTFSPEAGVYRLNVTYAGYSNLTNETTAFRAPLSWDGGWRTGGGDGSGRRVTR